MNQSNSEKIRRTVGDFFEKMGFPAQVSIQEPKDLTIPIEAKIEEPQILIGKSGETLADVQRLLKILIKKSLGTEKSFFIDLDINNYKRKKVEYLKETDRSIADEVSLSRREKELDPMPPYERRVIHIELEKRADVATESVGEGSERRIIVKPKP